MYFENCNFTMNSASEGGVFNIGYEGFLTTVNCNIYNNFALQSAVTRSGMDGGFNHIGGSIYNNIALSNLISEVIDCTPNSYFNGVTFYGNV